MQSRCRCRSTYAYTYGGARAVRLCTPVSSNLQGIRRPVYSAQVRSNMPHKTRRAYASWWNAHHWARPPRTHRSARTEEPRRHYSTTIGDARAAHAAALELGSTLQRAKAKKGKRPGQKGSSECAQVAHWLEELDSTLSLCELAADEQEQEVLDQATSELNDHRLVLRQKLLEEALLDPQTGQPSPSRCFLEFQAAPGGGDTCYWLDRLLTMYSAWAGQHAGFSSQLIATEPPFGTQEYVGGHRSACMELSGPQIAGWLRGESGVHCFKHVTPFGKNQVKQTGFVRVTVVPVVAEDQSRKPVFHKKDLRISTMRASGPGGQHVNTTESAVRIVHEPSGISVRVSTSRSQIANKNLAMTLLENKIRAAIAAEELSASQCVLVSMNVV